MSNKLESRFRMPQPNNDNLWVEAKLISPPCYPGGRLVSIKGYCATSPRAYLHEKHITQLALYVLCSHITCNRMLTGRFAASGTW